jgi:hypothetical protein
MYPPNPDPFDPDSLRLTADSVPAVRVELPSATEKRDKQFLPSLKASLFRRLVRLGGSALAVYLVIVLRSRLEKSNRVSLTSCFLTRFGLTRGKKRDGLLRLERDGLIRVHHHGRNNPEVELVE